MISAQQMSERFGPQVLAHIASTVRELSALPLATCDGTPRSPVLAAEARGVLIASKLAKANLSIAYDEQAIRDHATNYARICGRIATLDRLRAFAEPLGVALPAARHMTEEGLRLRLRDPMWWRRGLRTGWTRASENALREIGLIRRGKSPYASEDAVRHRRGRVRRTREWKEAHVMANEEGDELGLLALSDRSLANPSIRRAELMTRFKGLEGIAAELSHGCAFLTLTAPSAFHAQLSASGRNPLFERQAVRDAQDWMCRQWAKVRSQADRDGHVFYGFRTVEPHHDGTPHWHMCIFASESDLLALESIFRRKWLSEYSTEPGANFRRCNSKRIDPKLGSAIGYIAKYIAKNVDGHGAVGSLEDAETGSPTCESVERILAWASVHGIRQFQQFGGPAIGLWRELRRVRTPICEPAIETLRQCADTRDFHGFIKAAHPLGIFAGRSTAIRLEVEQVGDRNRYGETIGPRVVGVRHGSTVVRTRPYTWRVRRRTNLGLSVLSDLGPVAITIRRPPHGPGHEEDRPGGGLQTLNSTRISAKNREAIVKLRNCYQ